MKRVLISLIPDAPEGFEHRIPTKRDLLGGQVSLLAGSMEQCCNLLEDFCERVAGLVITPGNTFNYWKIGPNLWHLQIATDSRYNLHEMAHFCLSQISANHQVDERNLHLEIELDRSKREHRLSREELSSHNKSLWEKVETLRDEIQKRQEAEAHLKIFKSFADSSQQGVGWIDAEGTIIYNNPTLNKLITGEDDRDLAGTNVLQYYIEPDRRRLKNDVLPTLQKNGCWSGELTILSTSGDPILTHHSTFLIHDEHGGGEYLASIIVDLRERRKTEQELLKIKKLESVGMLAGGIAHDFNNTLTSILGNLDLAAQTLSPQSDVAQMIEEARKASIQAKGLAMQLLTFANGGDPVRKTASIGAIIRDSADFVLRGRNVRCSCRIPKDLWPAEIDTGQISQVIQNLTINAADAMPEGGTVEITCENVTKSDHAGSISITIADTGNGIPSADLDKVFDPYFTTKDGASGLGLSICHSIIQKHGGRLSLQSKPDCGTTITILLPRSTACAAPAGKPPKLRFLIMDDEPMICSISQRILTRLGHEALVAKSGEEAIEIYRSQLAQGAPIDITIMDLTIPGGMGGKEAIKRIHEIDPAAVAIVASGYSSDPVMANHSDFGFAAAIVKPYGIEDLKAIISKVTAKPERMP